MLTPENTREKELNEIKQNTIKLDKNCLVIRNDFGFFSGRGIKIHMLYDSRIITLPPEKPLGVMPYTRTWEV